MRRLIHRLKKDVKGSVSIFFILIIAAVFMFNAVLIDYARVLAADKQSEYAIQSAVRSSLAAYDNGLREFGLFGVEKDAVDFNDLLKKNIEVEEADFSFIDPKVEKAEIVYDETRALAQPDILNAQILEEMKYKAPVEIVKEILEKFSFVSKAMKETSTFVNTAGEIQGDVENREKKLDQIPGQLSKAKSEFEVVLKDLTATSKAKYPSVTNYNDIGANLRDYQKDLDQTKELKKQMEELKTQLADIQKNDPENEDGKKAIQDQIDKLNKQIQEMSKNADLFKANANKKINELNDHFTQGLNALYSANTLLGEANAYNQSIQKKIAKNRAEADKNYGDAISVDSTRGKAPDGANKSGLDQTLGNVKKVSDQLDQYVYDKQKDGYDFFGELSTHINSAIADAKKAPSFKVNLDINSLSTIKNAVRNSLKDDNNPSIGAIPSVAAAIDFFNKKRKKTSAKDEALINSKKAEADKKAKEASDKFKMIPDDGDTYKKLSTLFEQYKKFAEDHKVPVDAEGNLKDPNLKGGGKQAGMDAIALVDTLFRNLGNILVSARDRLYVNEYVMMNFESAAPKSFSTPEDYEFKKREVEYILYGFHAPGANYTAALAQLFAIRTALRLIDAFTKPEIYALGVPLLVFFAALAYALGMALTDVEGLARSASPEPPLINETLTPPSIIKINYRDYLRLFMFMNPNGNERLLRIMGVIQYKSKIDLRERFTYVHGNVTTSTRLWFIPDIAKALKATGVLDGKVNKENRYEDTKEAYFSY